jgi:hypothetical protein
MINVVGVACVTKERKRQVVRRRFGDHRSSQTVAGERIEYDKIIGRMRDLHQRPRDPFPLELGTVDCVCQTTSEASTPWPLSGDADENQRREPVPHTQRMLRRDLL